jgi:hypothetical protein
LTVSGKIDNVGDGEAFSPTIWVEVLGSEREDASGQEFHGARWALSTDHGAWWRAYVDKYAFEVKRKK